MGNSLYYESFYDDKYFIETSEEKYYIPFKNRIYSDYKEFEDAWNYIDIEKSNKIYNYLVNNSNISDDDLNYTIFVNCIENRFISIPLKDKYSNKYLCIIPGYKWTMSKLYTYMSHYVPWQFIILFDGGNILYNPRFIVRRVMLPSFGSQKK